MITVKNITKKYNEEILKNISFNIPKASIIGIAGKNGSGKSTLLKIIASILKPDSGEVTVNGESLIKNPNTVKKYIGYVSQENSLFDDLSVKDNINFFSNLYGVRIINYNLADNILNKKIKELSGGMKKRVNILVSLLNNPDFLLMDEPTANLDLYYKNQVLEIIKDYKNKGKTVVLTSHDTNELLSCDKIYVIQDGTFIFSDNPNKLNESDNFAEEIYNMIKI